MNVPVSAITPFAPTLPMVTTETTTKYVTNSTQLTVDTIVFVPTPLPLSLKKKDFYTVLMSTNAPLELLALATLTHTASTATGWQLASNTPATVTPDG
jgi:hypothetical protein